MPEPPKPSKELIEAGQREDECAAARDRAEQELAAAQEHDAALEAIAAARTALTAADRDVRAAHQDVVALRDRSG